MSALGRSDCDQRAISTGAGDERRDPPARAARPIGLRVRGGRELRRALQEFLHWPTHEAGAVRRDAEGRLPFAEGWGVVLVLIPGGTFAMGSEREPEPGPNHLAEFDEGPVGRVRLDPFLISKYEMTQDQWHRATGTNPAAYPPGRAVRGHGPIGPLNPIESVSWNTCDPVLRRLGLQLPTESQWEYAARGGTTTQFWNGDDRESLRGNANIADASLGEVNTNPLDWVWREYDDGYPLHAPVHTLAPNPFGLHHVTGNVGEWCYDWYAFYRYPLLHGDGQQVTSSDDRRGRVFRPGNWSDLWLFARSSVRHSIGPEA